MQENFKPEFEKETEKSATDAHLKGLNPQLWNELSDLSPEQQDKHWFDLTQKHLNDYRDGKSSGEGFKSEELEFLFLNRLGLKSVPTLNSEMPQRGFYFDPEGQPKQRMEKFGNFGNFIRTIHGEAEKYIGKTSKPFQILVGGIGISGKATLRNVLARELSEKNPEQKKISWDRDYQKLFPIPSEWQGDINIIEDVHGLDDKRDEGGKFERFDGTEGLPEGYDVVIYVLPTAKTFKQNLLRRGTGWLQVGKLDLTAPGEKQYSENREQKVKQTADELERFLPEAKKWFREQLEVLRELKNKGVKIAVVEPSEILKTLYKFEKFEEKPELLDKSFSEALTILFEEKDKI